MKVGFHFVKSNPEHHELISQVDFVQVFNGSPRSLAVSPLSFFISLNKPFIVHSKYFVHLDSESEEVFEKSLNLAKKELLASKVKTFLGYLVHVSNPSLFVLRWQKIFDELSSEYPYLTPQHIILENASNCNPYRLVSETSDLGCWVCLDTAHLWSYGTPVSDYVKLLSYPNVRFVHFNNVCSPFGNMKDKHAPLFSGLISVSRIKQIAEFLSGTDKFVLREKPFDDLKNELVYLKSLRGGKKDV